METCITPLSDVNDINAVAGGTLEKWSKHVTICSSPNGIVWRRQGGGKVVDVSQAQLTGRHDVVLEFCVNDTTGANEKDSLIELSFHIPNTNTTFTRDENRAPAQVRLWDILSST